jgi:hypothetical protein
MPITAAAITAGGSLLGGLLGGSSARRAAQAQADAQIKAAQIAAEEARFRPVGITTRFGQSAFEYGPEGRVTGAGYQLAPEFQAYQNRLLGLAGQGLTQAEMAPSQFAPLTGAGARLFGLGEQYLAETPEQVAAKYMASQQNLLAPSRERQYAQLQNQLFQTGRGGLSVGATGMRPGGGAGLGATNPELEAYYNAIAQQDAALAAQAQQAGQQQLAFGTGLFGTGAQMFDLYGRGQVGALAPYQAYLGGATGLEALGQQPLELGSALGGRIANPTGANALYQGGMAAARSQAAADAYNPFATALQGFAQNPDVRRGLESYFQPYNAAQQAMQTYGAGNVYGYGGQGTVPTSINWDI